MKLWEKFKSKMLKNRVRELEIKLDYLSERYNRKIKEIKFTQNNGKKVIICSEKLGPFFNRARKEGILKYKLGDGDKFFITNKDKITLELTLEEWDIFKVY